MGGVGVSDSCWVPGPDLLNQDDALRSLVISSFSKIYQQCFADDPLVNAQLPIEIRALRDIAPWRVFLLLTPWMLARVYLCSASVSIKVPDDWRASNRESDDYQAMGPQLVFRLLGREQRAHVNYHPALGHYLIQPLIMRMQQYCSATEVFLEWNRVIETRNENIRKRQVECQCQQEISRREFFIGRPG